MCNSCTLLAPRKLRPYTRNLWSRWCWRKVMHSLVHTGLKFLQPLLCWSMIIPCANLPYLLVTSSITWYIGTSLPSSITWYIGTNVHHSTSMHILCSWQLHASRLFTGGPLGSPVLPVVKSQFPFWLSLSPLLRCWPLAPQRLGSPLCIHPITSSGHAI